ncbi:type II secretion system protein [Photobacterium jeanii]|uniref:type II secretion system protein n=1 Tax=Photobacterium jeanii TaxID=858640 RepID=UPI0009FEAF68|nr:type II secretion system protein [Photobacterium jeanii]PST89311.1 type II secretion system protein [Photobacterium jeanii]
MKIQKGFTLVELVAVIVVLGIIAVTAAPRFLNVQSDARIATLLAAKGAIESANGIVFGKAAIDGKESGKAAIGATAIDTMHGNIVMTRPNFLKAVDTDMVVVDANPTQDAELSTAVAIVTAEGHTEKDKCFLEVVNHYGYQRIIYKMVTTGC